MRSGRDIAHHRHRLRRADLPLQRGGPRDAAHHCARRRLWVDVRDPNCPADPFANAEKYPGAAVGARGVLCLAFPLHPPGRPEKSRLDELEAVTVPTLVVQGERDPFGIPPGAVTVGGDHSLKSDLEGVAAAVRDWLGVLTRS